MTSSHFSVTLIKRSKGQSMVTKATYQARERIYDERAQKWRDGTRKKDVVFKEIIAPHGEWERGALWNTIEKDRRKDAQLGREIIIGLPRELSHAQHRDMVRDFVRENFTAKGFVVDCCYHDRSGSDGLRQPHVHLLVTLRPLQSDGSFGLKAREWNGAQKESLKRWRKSWEQHANTALERAGRPERISLDNYKVQGVKKAPQRHLGQKAWQMEQKGIVTQKGDRNRRASHFDTVRLMMKACAIPRMRGFSQAVALHLLRCERALHAAHDLSGAREANMRAAAQNLRQGRGRDR